MKYFNEHPHLWTENNKTSSTVVVSSEIDWLISNLKKVEIKFNKILLWKKRLRFKIESYKTDLYIKQYCPCFLNQAERKFKTVFTFRI